MKLEVGKDYIDNSGNVVRIQVYSSGEPGRYGFMSNNQSYREDGRAFAGREFDLIKEVEVQWEVLFGSVWCDILKRSDIFNNGREGVHFLYEYEARHMWAEKCQIRQKPKKKEISKTISIFLCDDGSVRTYTNEQIYPEKLQLKKNGINYKEIHFRERWEVK